jgi:hypothetical protein
MDSYHRREIPSCVRIPHSENQVGRYGLPPRQQRFHLGEQVDPDRFQLFECFPPIEKMPVAQGELRIRQILSNRLPHTHPAGAVGAVASGQFPDPAGGLVERGVDAAAGIDDQTLQCVRHPLATQMGVFHKERPRVHDHGVAQDALHSWNEGSGAELRKGMVPSIGQNHVVAGLRTAVETDHRARLPTPTQTVNKQAFAAIAEPKPDHRSVARSPL